MPHDPIKDENKEYTLNEFIDVAIEELQRYRDECKNINDFYNKKHTWSEWFNAFIRWMSW